MPEPQLTQSEQDRLQVSDDAAQAAAAAAAGGSEQLAGLMSWTRESLSAPERAAVQRRLNAADISEVVEAVMDLKQARDLSARADAVAAGRERGGFANSAEYFAALRAENPSSRSPEFLIKVANTPFEVIEGRA